MKFVKLAVAVAAVGLLLTFSSIGVAAPTLVDGFGGDKITWIQPGWVGDKIAGVRTPGWVG